MSPRNDRGSAPMLVLASGSPRRRHVMSQLGLSFETVAPPAGLEPPWDGAEAPVAFAERLARMKAAAVGSLRPDAIIVAADTVVVLDAEVLEKPRDAAHAGEMLTRLAGREHMVHTGVAVQSPDGVALAPAGGGRAVVSGVESTAVRFRPLAPAAIEAYVATGEPLDKAGAYGIQGYGAALVESVHGCYFNVMGFPVTRVLSLLDDLGWRYEFPGWLTPTDDLV
ncbi:MAG TPA: Maf family protein [Gemmatimonadota bacterium]|nr:Maf family protein [Gemmatimonadota bacterium]